MPGPSGAVENLVWLVSRQNESFIPGGLFCQNDVSGVIFSFWRLTCRTIENFGLGFQHISWDLAKVNAWKTKFDPCILCSGFRNSLLRRQKSDWVTSSGSVPIHLKREWIYGLCENIKMDHSYWVSGIPLFQKQSTNSHHHKHSLTVWKTNTKTTVRFWNLISNQDSKWRKATV